MDKTELLERLNLSLPAVAAPMFIVSQLGLVKACCKNGILGTFPALNNRSTEGFEEWLIDLKKDLSLFENESGKKAAAFGVNLVVHHSNPRVEADLEVCVRQKVPVVITSLGAMKRVVDRVHSYGGLVFHDVINARHAQKAIEAGVDGLICVCAGAGGHGGTLNPFAFVSEVRKMFDGIVLLGGGIGSGREIAAALQLGADLAYMGTRFINTEEAIADPDYKRMVIDSGSSDIIYTSAVSGVKANFMKESLERAGIGSDMWKSKEKLSFGEGLGAESKAWKNIWSAGHGATNIKETMPAQKLIERLKAEFLEALDEQHKLKNKWD